MNIPVLILEGLNKKKKEKKEKMTKTDPNQPKEFELAQLYNYLKSYIMAKFKVGEVKLKELKLDPDYFMVKVVTSKESLDKGYVIDQLILAVSKKFEIKADDIAITVDEITGNSNENILIGIEYFKKEE